MLGGKGDNYDITRLASIPLKLWDTAQLSDQLPEAAKEKTRRRTGALPCGDQHARNTDATPRIVHSVHLQVHARIIGGGRHMENEDDHADLKRQLAEVAHVLNSAERELWAAMQNLIDQQAQGGVQGSRGRHRAQSLAKGERHESAPAASVLQGDRLRGPRPAAFCSRVIVMHRLSTGSPQQIGDETRT
jgi:hypothetical protein